MKIAITGGPNTGKTTLASKLGMPVKGTDSLIELGWSAASFTASHWFDEPGPLIVEGVAVARALRKWLYRNPQGKPVDRLVVLSNHYIPPTPGQVTMTKGLATVLQEICPELKRRGVEVIVE